MDAIRNEKGELMTVVEIANELIKYLGDMEIIPEKVVSHMSYKSLCGYTQEYFCKNIGVLAAMNDVPEDKWKTVEAKILEPRYSQCFGKSNKGGVAY